MIIADMQVNTKSESNESKIKPRLKNLSKVLTDTS